MIDIYNLNDNAPERNFAKCSGKVQGISSGWVDLYDYSLPGQCMGIGSLNNGIYYLRIRANPLKLFKEKTTKNNVAWVSFKLSGERENRKLDIIDHSDCSFYPGLCGENAPLPSLIFFFDFNFRF